MTTTTRPTKRLPLMAGLSLQYGPIPQYLTEGMRLGDGLVGWYVTGVDPGDYDEETLFVLDPDSEHPMAGTTRDYRDRCAHIKLRPVVEYQARKYSVAQVVVTGWDGVEHDAFGRATWVVPQVAVRRCAVTFHYGSAAEVRVPGLDSYDVDRVLAMQQLEGPQVAKLPGEPIINGTRTLNISVHRAVAIAVDHVDTPVPLAQVVGSLTDEQYALLGCMRDICRQVAAEDDELGRELTEDGWLPGADSALWIRLNWLRLQVERGVPETWYGVDISSGLEQLSERQRVAGGWIWYLETSVPGYRFLPEDRWQRIRDARTASMAGMQDVFELPNEYLDRIVA